VSHLPSISSRFDLDARAVGAHYHSTGLVGAEHFGANSRQGAQHVDTRMPILITGADRNDRNVWMNSSQKCIAAAGGAAVMTDFQNIGAQLIPMLVEQPVFFGAFRISHKQKAHHSEAGNGDSARQIGIFQPDSPGGVGREKRDAYPIDQDGVARVNAMPLDALFPRRGKRKAVRVRPARERRIPVGAGTHCSENACRSTNVIRVRMRKDERVERAPAVKDVRQHSRATGVTTLPGRTRIEENPVTSVCSKQDRVALTDVEHMKLDLTAW